MSIKPVLDFYNNIAYNAYVSHAILSPAFCSARERGGLFFKALSKNISQEKIICQLKQKSLEWTIGKGLLLPPWLTIQGSLSVSQKEEVVNKVIL